MSGAGSGEDEASKARDEQSRDALDSVTIAAFDVDSRIFRTIWHSLIRPNDVARSALTADYSQYLSPIRVFVALFSFQFAVAALFGAPINYTLDAMVTGLPPNDVEAWLATGRPQPLTAREIDPVLSRFMAAFLWPITAVSSVPYLILLKLYRPSVSWWGHLLLYLVPINGSFIMMIGFMPLYPFFQEQAYALFGLSTVLSMILYFILAGWVVARFYARTALGTALRVTGLVALLPITLLITVVMQTVAAFWLLNSEFGLSAAELFSGL